MCRLSLVQRRPRIKERPKTISKIFSPQQPLRILTEAKGSSNYWPMSDLISDLAWFNISLYPFWLTGLCPNCVLHRSAHGPQTDTYRRAHTHTLRLTESSENKAGLCQCKHGPLLWALFPASYLRSPWRPRAVRGTALAQIPLSGVILRIRICNHAITV